MALAFTSGALAAWRACAIIVAMGSFGSARLPLNEASKALKMVESRKRDLVRLLILPGEGA